jgi:hypothetical protein
MTQADLKTGSEQVHDHDVVLALAAHPTHVGNAAYKRRVSRPPLIDNASTFARKQAIQLVLVSELRVTALDVLLRSKGIGASAK